MASTYRSDFTDSVPVRDYMDGATRIVVFDDYCKNMTHEDGEKVMARISKFVYPHLLYLHLRDLEKANEAVEIPNSGKLG